MMMASKAGEKAAAGTAKRAMGRGTLVAGRGASMMAPESHDIFSTLAGNPDRNWKELLLDLGFGTIRDGNSLVDASCSS